MCPSKNLLCATFPVEKEVQGEVIGGTPAMIFKVAYSAGRYIFTLLLPLFLA